MYFLSPLLHVTRLATDTGPVWEVSTLFWTAVYLVWLVLGNEMKVVLRWESIAWKSWRIKISTCSWITHWQWEILSDQTICAYVSNSDEDSWRRKKMVLFAAHKFHTLNHFDNGILKSLYGTWSAAQSESRDCANTLATNWKLVQMQ